MSEKYFLDGHYYQYDLGWIIDQLKSVIENIQNIYDIEIVHYADPIQWDITAQYPQNTVVVNPQTGDAYISKTNVPVGVLLTNTSYWLPIFNYQGVADKVNTALDGVERLTEKTDSLDMSVKTLTTAVNDNDEKITDLQERMTTAENDLNADRIEIDSLDGRVSSLEDTINDPVYFYVTGDAGADITERLQQVATSLPKSKKKIILIQGDNLTLTGSVVFSDVNNLTILTDGTVVPSPTAPKVAIGVLHFVNCENVTLKVKMKNAEYNKTCSLLSFAGCTNVNIADSLLDIAQIGYDGNANVSIRSGCSYISVTNSYICGQYGVLVNSDTTDVHHIRVENCHFEGQSVYSEDSHGEAVEINTPSSHATDITVSGCTFANYTSNRAMARNLVLGFAGAYRVNVTGNSFTEIAAECVHLENGCADIVVSSNNMNRVQSGVVVISNSTATISDINISGNQIYCNQTYAQDTGFAINLTTGANPQAWIARIVIANNQCYGTTAADGGIGVHCALDCSITGNNVIGFPRGGLDVFSYSTTSQFRFNIMSIIGNTIVNCGWGLRLGGSAGTNTFLETFANLVVRENLITGATYGAFISKTTGNTLHDVRCIGGNNSYWSVGDVKAPFTRTATDYHDKLCTVAGETRVATFIDI